MTDLCSIRIEHLRKHIPYQNRQVVEKFLVPQPQLERQPLFLPFPCLIMAPAASKFYTPLEAHKAFQNLTGKALPGTDSEKAAGRAALRYNSHIDGRHSQCNVKNGLHLNYLELWKNLS